MHPATKGSTVAGSLHGFDAADVVTLCMSSQPLVLAGMQNSSPA